MGLVSAILTLPIAPVRAVVWVGDVLREEVERQMFDPAVIRRELQAVDSARAEGRIDPADADRLERELVGRLVRPTPSGPEEG
ncbi:gas vesicle protein GvpG [Dactylosporangium sucinum]|uniref:Gas vesicle protein n=1 Tax=Dactylosporangium sucinum TaxID=1424081 RepID=A0A917TYR7_9ACTN|nr:gas vesicle protein GvpG [Dactylosporangium sucinum]GGM44532.1 gas vesicle protein [Dactylosporangium sucinum]